MWLAGPVREALDRRRVPVVIAEASAMTLAATVATAPLLALHFGQVSLVSLPANLVVAPVVAPVMWLGMSAAAVAQFSPAAAIPLTVVNGPLVAFVDQVADIAARLPHATVDVRVGGVVGVGLGYAGLGVGWHIARAVARRRRRWTGAAPITALVTIAFGLVVVRPHAGVAAPRPGESVVTFLDIGQGDAPLVQRDGAAVLFDTGPPDGGIVTRLRAVGVRRLDALVLTHAQADHEGAAIPVLDRLRPRWILDGGAGWDTPVQRALPAAAAAAG